MHRYLRRSVAFTNSDTKNRIFTSFCAFTIIQRCLSGLEFVYIKVLKAIVLNRPVRNFSMDGMTPGRPSLLFSMTAGNHRRLPETTGNGNMLSRPSYPSVPRMDRTAENTAESTFTTLLECVGEKSAHIGHPEQFLPQLIG